MLITKFNTENIDKIIEEFEKRNDIQLPKMYRCFLINYNGGITVETSFRLNKISSDIVGFYGLGKVDDAFSLNEFEQMGILSDYIEKGILPIAYNDFGDKIVIGITDENSGKIYFLYHDEGNIVELISDFNAFIQMCKSEKIGHIPSIEERKKIMIENGLGDKITEESIRGWQAEIDEYKNICQEKVILK